MLAPSALRARALGGHERSVETHHAIASALERIAARVSAGAPGVVRAIDLDDVPLRGRAEIAFGLPNRERAAFPRTNPALRPTVPCVDVKLALRLLSSLNMKEGNASARKVACRTVFALGCFVSIQLSGARGARAESPRKVAGFEALATLGYGVAVGAGDKYEPYGVMVGLDLGYTLPFGLRIGVDASHGFGRKIEQTLSTGEVETTEAGSSAFGGSVGYDHLLWSSFRLRGAVDAGLIGFWTSTDRGPFPGLALYCGPKVALIWQYGAFELGLQSKYWVTTADHGVFQVGIMSGARF